MSEALKITVGGKEVKAWGDFEVYPAGYYLVEIKEVQDRVASTGNRGFSFRAEILDVLRISGGFEGDVSQFIGQAIWENIYNVYDDPPPDWLPGRLKMMFLAVGVPEDAFPMDVTRESFLSLAGEQVIWNVGVRNNRNTGEPQNTVRSWIGLDRIQEFE